MRTTGHGILVKQKAAQHYCQNTFKKAVHRIMYFTFRYLLSQKQRNLRRKKKISSEGHILFAFDELKCKKQLKHLVKEKKRPKTTELLESDDLVDGVVSMETVGNATAELTTSTREYEQDVVQAQTRKL